MNIKHSQRPEKEVFMDEAAIRDALSHMEQDSSLKTEARYATDSLTLNHFKSFSEKHATYLKNHPKVNPEHYLSNLRTMIKIR